MRNRIALLAVLALAACHSSRYAYRFELPPQQAATEEPAPAQPAPQVMASQPVDQRTPLQQAIDQLLSSDTISQTAQVAVCAYDVTANCLLYERGSLQRMRPASTEKVVTAVAALDLLGPSYSFQTQLLSAATVQGHTLRGDVYVRGVMDPLLGTADLRQLAAQLKAAGITRIEGCLVGDNSFKDSDEWGWGWCWDDDNPVLSPLLCGGKPTLTTQLLASCRAAGITVSRGAAANPAKAPAQARTLATFSRPLTDVLLPMMKESNNLCAEAVFYHVAASPQALAAMPSTPKSYSRRRAAAAIAGVIGQSRRLPVEGLPISGGILSNIADGSGLSLYNYQTAETFIRLLNYAARREDILPALWEALPVAATDGTLKNRMTGTPAASVVRAKTGSVSAVSTLAGYTIQASSGHLIAFAVLTQGVQQMAQGRNLQDQVCILLTNDQ